MIEVGLSKIIIDEEKKEQVVVLKAKNSDRSIPMVIGLSEAVAIKIQLSGFKPPRPLTHDLLKSLLDTLEVKLEKVVIDRIVDGTFFAKLYLQEKNGHFKIVDARPSDSIALSLRTKSPIFIKENVFGKLTSI